MHGQKNIKLGYYSVYLLPFILEICVFSCKRTVLLCFQDCFLEILPVNFVLWIDQQK